jgi:hypothetical protein
MALHECKTVFTWRGNTGFRYNSKESRHELIATTLPLSVAHVVGVCQEVYLGEVI